MKRSRCENNANCVTLLRHSARNVPRRPGLMYWEQQSCLPLWLVTHYVTLHCLKAAQLQWHLCLLFQPLVGFRRTRTLSHPRQPVVGRQVPYGWAGVGSLQTYTLQTLWSSCPLR